MNINLEQIKAIKELLTHPGWRCIDQILKKILEENIEIVKTEYENIDRLKYSQAIIYIIENLYKELDSILAQTKREINLIKKYQKGE